LIAEFFTCKTKAELFDAARERNLLIAPIATISDVLQNPQFHAREYWRKLVHPQTGISVTYPGPFARFGAQPIAFRRRPPLVGEHNHEILVGELKMSERDFCGLQQEGIV
jgi:crotonobetainyl-CoA:carnitine CoA-transferase CaiB-like acyl-CoA transferase